MADQISNIVDVGGITGDLKIVIDGIVNLEKEIDIANGKAITVKVDLQGAESLNELNRGIKQVQDSVKQLSSTEAENKNVVQQLQQVQEAYGDTIMSQVKTLVDQKMEMSYVTERVKALTKGIQDGSNATEIASDQLIEYTRRQKELQAEILASNNAIKQQVTANNAVEGSIAGARAAAALYRKELQSINLTTEEGIARQKELVIEIDRLNAFVEANSEKATRDKINVGRYPQLQQEIEVTKVKLQELTEAGKENTAEFREAEVEAQRLATALKSINSPSSGGGFVSPTTSAQLTSTTRQMQALALAGKKDSEEFRILEAEAQKLRAAMNEVNVSIRGTTSTLDKFASIVERMGLRMIANLVIFQLATTLITAMWEEFTKLSRAEEMATERMDAFTSSAKEMEDFTANLTGAIDVQKTTIEGLIAVLTDETQTIEAKTKAYKDLQSIMPGVLRNYTLQDIASGKNAAAFKQQANYVAEATESLKANIAAYQKNAPILHQLEEEYLKGDSQPNNLTTAHREEQDRLTKSYLLLKADQDKRKAEIIQQQKDIADYVAPDIKAKKQPKDNAKGLESELKLEQERYKLQVETNKLIYDNSRKTFEEQKQLDAANLEAAQGHGEAMLAIITKWHGKVNEDENKYAERKVQVAADQLRVENATNEADAKIAKEIQDRHEKANKDLDDLIENYKKGRAELEKLSREYDLIKSKSEIDHDATKGLSPYLAGLGIDMSYLQEKKKRNNEIKSHEANISDLTDQKGDALAVGDGTKVLEIESKIQKEKNDIAQLEADNQAAIDAKIMEGKKKVAEQTIELAEQTMQAMATIRNNEFAQEQQKLQYQQEQLQITSQQRIAAINATTGFAITKENQVAQVVAQTTAQQNSLQQQQNQLALKKAKADKQAAESGVLLSTALAIAKALPLLADPLTIPLGIAEIALITATGAVQYAAASSTPLPQFEAGGTTTTPYFIAAEKNKRETFVYPDGTMRIAQKEGVYSAPIGTQVLNNSDTERMLAYAINGIGRSNMGVPEFKQTSISTKKLEDKIDNLTDATIQAAMIGRIIKNNLTVNVNNPLQRK